MVVCLYAWWVLFPVSAMSVAGLVNPVLAFIKAFRLRGDREGLVQLVIERFDAGSLVTAKKLLWDKCKLDLEVGGLTFHSRRASEKRSQAVAELDDINEAFELLDSHEKLPAIFCEANDLLNLPPLCLDPVSDQLLENTNSINKIDTSIQELKEQLSSTRASLSKDLASVKLQISKPQGVPSSLPASDSGTGTTQQHSQRSQQSSSHSLGSGRQSNLILFGLEEKSTLSDTKSSVDEILTFLAGRPVAVNDLVRLGRSIKQSDPVLPTRRPRPVLIKLSTAWDRRLILASKRKLKEFHVSRLYIREDLSLEDRQLRARSSNGGNRSENHSSGLNPSPADEASSVSGSPSSIAQVSGVVADPLNG